MLNVLEQLELTRKTVANWDGYGAAVRTRIALTGQFDCGSSTPRFDNSAALI